MKRIKRKINKKKKKIETTTNSNLNVSESTKDVHDQFMRNMLDGLFKPNEENDVSKPSGKVMRNNTDLQYKRFNEFLNEKLQPKARYRLVYLLDQLRDEENLADKAYNVLNTKWRENFRLQRVSSLKTEFLNLLEFKQLDIDKRNLVLEQLTKQLDLNEAFIINSNKQLSIDFKDKFISVFQQVMELLRVNFIKEVEAIKAQFMNEFRHLNQIHENKLQQISNYIYTIEMLHADDSKYLSATFKRLEDEINLNHQNELLSLKFNYGKKINALNDESKYITGEYEKTRKGYLKNYLNLCKLTSDFEAQYLKHECLISNLIRKIKKLKACTMQTEILDLRKESLVEANTKKREKELEFANQNRLSRRKLIELCKVTNETIESMKEKHKKATNIIKLIKLCKKLELDDEAFQKCYKLHENIFCPCINENDSVEQYLTKLYSKYNAVALHVYSLQHERKCLNEQNSYLQNQLKEYFSSLTNKTAT